MKRHTDAVVALAKTAAPFASKTFVSVAARSATGALPKSPYNVIHPADGTDSSDRLSGPPVSQHPRFTFHIAGDDYDQVAAGVDLLKAKFIPGGIGHTFIIPGELCGRVWWESPMPIQVDTDVSPPLVYAVIELGFSTDPA